MADRLIDRLKTSVPLEPTSLNNTNTTGRYVSMARCARLKAILSTGALAATKTVKLELLKATDSAGSDAEAITPTATLTANTKVTKATIALASAAATDTVTVTTYIGTTQADTATFTMAEATDTAAGEFADAAGLDACIDAAITGATPSTSTTNVILVADDGYNFTVTSSNEAGTVTVATNAGVVVVEMDEGDMGLGGDFTHIAPKVTSTGNGYNTVVFEMEMKDLPEANGNVGTRYPTS